MAKKVMVVFLIIFMGLFSSGCWNQVNINDTAVCAGLGADLTDSGKILFMAQLNKPVNPQVSAGESQFVVSSGVGDTMIEAARKIMLTLPRIPLWPHADAFVIGEKLAKDDLTNLLDFLFRNRNIRMSSSVLVAHNTTLGEMYNSDCPLSLCSARGILKILRTQEHILGIYVPVTLNELIVKSATPGIDPFAPMISVTKDLKDQNILTINGTAIFNGPKMAGILDVTESRGLFWLVSGKRGAMITVSLPDNPEVKISLELNESKSNIRPLLKDGKLTMNITVDTQFNLKEISGRANQQDPQFIRKVEAAAQKEIEQHIRASIAKGQQVNSDFLGFGRMIYRYHPKYWQKIKGDWPTIYPQVQTNVEVKSKLIFSDLINNNMFP